MNDVLALNNDPFLKGSHAATPAPRQREIPAPSEETSPPWPSMADDDDDLLKFKMALDKDD